MFKPFSHIYIEKAILEHPRTLAILKRFPKVVPIVIEHYKDVFSPQSQNFFVQKQSPKLLLAKKEEPFLYRGSDFSPNFSFANFYYNTLALNCIYDCEYCYLQGMFPSANLVLFVNWEDFFQSTDSFLQNEGSLYLALSYDTDLLAMESFFPASSAWIKYAESQPNLTLEIRTKSVAYGLLRGIKPTPNVILAWTLSPNYVVEHIERGTPKLEHRLEAMKKAIKDGWKVRICIDPVLLVPNWKEKYLELVQILGKELDTSQILDVSFGGFRMNVNFAKTIQRGRQDSSILFHDFEKKDQILSYKKEETEEILSVLSQALEMVFSKEQIKPSYL